MYIINVFCSFLKIRLPHMQCAGFPRLWGLYIKNKIRNILVLADLNDDSYYFNKTSPGSLHWAPVNFGLRTTGLGF